MALHVAKFEPVFLDSSFPLPLDGPFTRAMAAAHGLDRALLRKLVHEGLVRHLTQRVYVAAQVPDSRDLRREALALVAPPGSVICDWTACWYWTGMDRPGRHQLAEIDVFRFRGHERLRNGLARSGQRWFLEEDVVPLGNGLFVASSIRTAWDLGRFNAPVVAMGGMDALVRVGDFEKQELIDGVERFKKQRGVVMLRWLAPRVDGRSESFGESGLRVRWEEAAGLPSPELQIVVPGPYGEELRVDLGVEELLFGAEYDGEEFHGPEHEDSDAARRGYLQDQRSWALEVFRRPGVFGQHHDASVRLAHAFREARKTYARRTRGTTRRF